MPIPASGRAARRSCFRSSASRRASDPRRRSPLPDEAARLRATDALHADRAGRRSRARVPAGGQRREPRRTIRSHSTLDVSFRLDGATLHVEVTVANPGEAPLPASFGFHPAFAWPLPYGRDRADHRITFSRDEPDGAARDRRRRHDRRRRARRRRSTAARSRSPTICSRTTRWSGTASARDRVTYGASDGPAARASPFPTRRCSASGPSPARTSSASSRGTASPIPQGYTGELRDKPGVFVVAPGGAKQIAMSVTLVP